MKIYGIILSVLGAASVALSTSCHGELDVTQSDKLNTTNMWTSESDALTATTGIYYRLRQAFAQLPELQRLLADNEHEAVQQLAERASTFPELLDLLERAIMEVPPVLIRDGGVIRDGLRQTSVVRCSGGSAQRGLHHGNTHAFGSLFHGGGCGL